MAEKFGAWIMMGGVPVDLFSGMLDAMINPPPGFKSKFKFEQTDLKPRIEAIEWFSHCGEPANVDLTMEICQVQNWAEAMKSCKSDAWLSAALEAKNQLTIFMSVHATERYQQWNDLVDAYREAIVNQILNEKIRPFQTGNSLEETLVWHVRGELTGALMENSFIDCGHSAFFSLELLRVYEAGHFPCGWERQWPEGRLLVY